MPMNDINREAIHINKAFRIINYIQGSISVLWALTLVEFGFLID
jgi:hypothetical protein